MTSNTVIQKDEKCDSPSTTTVLPTKYELKYPTVRIPRFRLDFQCPKCDLYAVDDSFYFVHLINCAPFSDDSEIEVKRWICRYYEENAERISFKKCITSVRPVPRYFTKLCLVCNYGTNDNNSLYRHVVTDHLCCPYCYYMGNQYSPLLKHVARCAKRRKSTCCYVTCPLCLQPLAHVEWEARRHLLTCEYTIRVDETTFSLMNMFNFWKKRHGELARLLGRPKCAVVAMDVKAKKRWTVPLKNLNKFMSDADYNRFAIEINNNEDPGGKSAPDLDTKKADSDFYTKYIRTLSIVATEAKCDICSCDVPIADMFRHRKMHSSNVHGCIGPTVRLVDIEPYLTEEEFKVLKSGRRPQGEDKATDCNVSKVSTLYSANDSTNELDRALFFPGHSYFIDHSAVDFDQINMDEESASKNSVEASSEDNVQITSYGRQTKVLSELQNTWNTNCNSIMTGKFELIPVIPRLDENDIKLFRTSSMSERLPVDEVSVKNDNQACLIENEYSLKQTVKEASRISQGTDNSIQQDEEKVSKNLLTYYFSHNNLTRKRSESEPQMMVKKKRMMDRSLDSYLRIN